MRRRKNRPVDVSVTRRELNDPLDDLFRAEEVTDDEGVKCHPHKINAPTKALAFMMAGNARVTFKSKTTGTRYTFRVRVSEDGKVHFVSLLTCSDNEASYSYFGYIRRGVFFHGGAKAKVGRDAESVKAFEWVYRNLLVGEMHNALEIWHEGRCGRCNRALTVPESIEIGIGPECLEKMFG